MAVFRAHADPESGPFGVELVVNGASAGVVEAVPRWQDYEFSVAVHQLRPGFNELELRFSAEENREERRLELAVNYLELRERERLVAASAEAPGKAGAVDEEPRKTAEDGKGVAVGEKVEAEERPAREMEVQHHEKGEGRHGPGAESEQETDTGGELGQRNDPREDWGGGDRDRLEVEAAQRAGEGEPQEQTEQRENRSLDRSQPLVRGAIAADPSLPEPIAQLEADDHPYEEASDDGEGVGQEHYVRSAYRCRLGPGNR